MSPSLAGIFVGGAGRRMGGLAKGLLRTVEGPTVVERWRTLLEELGLRVVLVGGNDAYGHLGLQVVDDAPPGIGPLGGLVGLLGHAGQAHVLALACDMPFVSSALVERLLGDCGAATIVAPRRDGRWEPLCARYDASRVLPLARRRVEARDHSLQRLLDDAGAVELALAPSEAGQLRDWDTADDLALPQRPPSCS